MNLPPFEDEIFREIMFHIYRSRTCYLCCSVFNLVGSIGFSALKHSECCLHSGFHENVTSDVFSCQHCKDSRPDSVTIFNHVNVKRDVNTNFGCMRVVHLDTRAYLLNLRVRTQLENSVPLLLNHTSRNRPVKSSHNFHATTTTNINLQDSPKVVYIEQLDKDRLCDMENGINILPLFAMLHIMKMQYNVKKYPDNPTVARSFHHIEFVENFIDIDEMTKNISKNEIDSLRHYISNDKNIYNDIVIIDSPQAFFAYWNVLPKNFLKNLVGANKGPILSTAASRASSNKLVADLQLTQNKSKRRGRGFVTLKTGFIEYEIDLLYAYRSMTGIFVNRGPTIAGFYNYISEACMEYIEGVGLSKWLIVPSPPPLPILLHPHPPSISVVRSNTTSSSFKRRPALSILETQLQKYKSSTHIIRGSTNENTPSSGKKGPTSKLSKRKYNNVDQSESDETEERSVSDILFSDQQSESDESEISSKRRRIDRLTSTNTPNNNPQNESMDSKEEEEGGDNDGSNERMYIVAGPNNAQEYEADKHNPLIRVARRIKHKPVSVLRTDYGRPDFARLETPTKRDKQIQKLDMDTTDAPNEIDMGGRSSMDHSRNKASLAIDKSGFTAPFTTFPSTGETRLARNLEDYIIGRQEIEPIPESHITADGFTENTHFEPYLTKPFERIPTKARSKMRAYDSVDDEDIASEESRRVQHKIKQMNDMKLMNQLNDFMNTHQINLASALEKSMSSEDTIIKPWNLDIHYGFIPFVIFLNGRHETHIAH